MAPVDLLDLPDLTASALVGAAATTDDRAMLDAVASQLTTRVVAAIRRHSIVALRDLGEAIGTFVRTGVTHAEAVSPGAAGVIEHLLPVLTEASRLDSPGSEPAVLAALGPTSRRVLQHVAQAPDGVAGRTEVRGALDLDEGNLSRALRGLEAAGLLERFRQDGVQSVVLLVTPRGRRVVGDLGVRRRPQRTVEHGEAVRSLRLGPQQFHGEAS